MGREVRVYNFGNSSFHSTQERARFEHFLMTNQIPDMAVFVDGLNEFGKPLESDEIQSVEASYDSEPRSPWRLALEQLPMVRAGRAIKKRVVPGMQRTGAALVVDSTSESRRIVESAIDRYLHNVQLCESAADTYGVEIVFVWQPIPMYRYDLSRHPFAKGGFPNNRFARAGYEYFAEVLETAPLGSDFLWCADMQRDIHDPLYVDKIHYSREMNRLLAKEIAAFATSNAGTIRPR